MLAAGAGIKGYASFEYVKDIGTPARHAKAAAQLRSGLVERASLTRKQKAVFLDRDGTLNLQRGFVTAPGQLDLIPGAALAVRRLNEAEFRAVLITNQPVIARGETTFDGLRRIHARLETLLGAEGAFLDAIYFCPHHTDKGFPGEVAALKIDCSCRKPKTGMIETAVRDLNIDLGRSWLVGDATRDIETARRAKIRSVLVKTGVGGTDATFAATPDYAVADVGAAVDLILSQEGDAR
jgi:histidinol-phosphate phosphatase family protein